MSQTARARWLTAGPIALACLVISIAPVSIAPVEAEDDPFALGRKVFVEVAVPQCSICHALADAGAAGTIAPSLDDLRPTTESVLQALVAGLGVMPTYRDQLTEEEMNAVAEYVSHVAGSQ